MADEENAPEEEAKVEAPEEEDALKEGEEDSEEDNQEESPEEPQEVEGEEGKAKPKAKAKAKAKKPVIDCPKPEPKKTLKQFQKEREKEKEEKLKQKEEKEKKKKTPEEPPAEEPPPEEKPNAEESKKKKKEKIKKEPVVYRRLDWTFYPTLCEIYNWMDVIIEKRPKIVTDFEIGRSYEGRLIRGLKLSFKTGNKAIFIESNIHAREWITSSSATCMVMELLFSEDPDVRRTAEGIDWYILPVFNVDGFVYSQEKERLWRKSRKPSKGKKTPECIGVDLNRNFNHQWGLIKHEPCSEQYGGTAAESEPEVKQLARFIGTITDLKVYIALHAAGQAVITPWSYTKEELPEGHKEMMEVAKAFVESAYPRFRTRYIYGAAAEILNVGEFCGTSTDWAYAVKNIPISLGIELPGKGRNKPFELPTESILRVSIELLDGFVGLIKAVGELGIIEKIPEPPKKEIKPKYERPKKAPKTTDEEEKPESKQVTD
uniref:Peptidase M14 domain-containing protein n=1 Tax=Glossina brevipalpis TaxID=37001 RepID=A0A1A9WUP7_9MUSC